MQNIWNKLLITILISVFIICNTHAGKIGVQIGETSNVVENYGKLLTDFLVENLENADYYIKTKEYSLVIKPFIGWVGTNYNLCIELLSYKNYPLKLSCKLAKNGEELYTTLTYLLEKTGDFIIKEKPKKDVFLVVKTRSNIKYSQYKVESQKGDVLVYYKDVINTDKQMPENRTINLGKVIIGLDSIYLNKDQANTLFKFLLENYKIKQILIKRY